MLIVYPSGAARATRPTPMVPAAPATLSTITVCPRASRNPSAITRAIVSVGPPAENGTTMVMGFDGYDCARVKNGQASPRAPALKVNVRRRIVASERPERFGPNDARRGHWEQQP
jgi:hypothetical protein